MQFVVRVGVLIDDADLAIEGYRNLYVLDEDAEMAQGADSVIAFWTTVSAKTPESAVAEGAGRVRSSLQVSAGLEESTVWPEGTQPLNLEVYPLEYAVLEHTSAQERVS